MQITVALFAYLARYQPNGGESRQARSVDVPERATVGDVIATLGLPDEPRVLFVNSRHAGEDTVLAEGDRLAIFPPVAGG